MLLGGCGLPSQIPFIKAIKNTHQNNIQVCSVDEDKSKRDMCDQRRGVHRAAAWGLSPQPWVARLWLPVYRAPQSMMQPMMQPMSAWYGFPSPQDCALGLGKHAVGVC